MKYHVTESWQASYDDPISLDEGADVELTDQTFDWDGYVWIWARAADGKEGWIPDDLVVASAGSWKAREAFSALELTCTKGEALEGERVWHGWVLCRADDGRVGWVPLRNLHPA